LFVLFILLCALNNHLSCLYAFTCAFTGVFFQNKNTILKYLLVCVCAVILYLPHWSITMAQFSQGGIGHAQDGWLPVPHKWVLFSFLKTLFGTGQVWMVFLLLLMVAFAITKEILVNKRTVILLILFFANYAIIYLYSVYKAPVFQYSVMLFSAPCFIWAATSIIKFKNKIALLIVSICSGILIYQSIIQKHFFTNAVLNQNGFQSKEYCRMEDKYGKEKVEALYMASQRYFVIAYELKYKRRFNYSIGEDFKTISAFKNHLENSKAEYLLLGEPTCLQLEIVKEYFPALLERWQTLNVNYYLLARSGTSTWAKFEKSTDSSFYLSPGKYNYVLNKEKLEGENFNVDSTDEFCYSAKAELNKLNLKEGNVILAKVKVQSLEQLNDVGFNFSVANAKDSTLFFGGTDIGQFYIADSAGYNAYAEIFIGSELKNWLRQDANITFFIWNRSKKKFKFSDFQIRTINCWSARWSWWE
ncbi:MAG TPA: hypothetical protein VN026_03110, partial [Bacteroidia bacterium]|nr:hypothetical protein [Bacteroidia bacterium]